LLLQVIDQAYDRKSWHGANLRGSIRGVEAATAVWRPGEGRHNIWERNDILNRPTVSQESPDMLPVLFS